MERKNFHSHWNELTNELRKLAEDGYTAQEILKKLDLSAKQADRLHVALLKAGKISPAIRLDFASTMGRESVAKKGNVFVTAHKLRSLGLEHLFAPKTRLQVERAGDCLVIRALPQDNLPQTNDDTQAEKTKAKRGRPSEPSLLKHVRHWRPRRQKS